MKLQTSRYRLHEDKLWANGHGGGLCSVNKPAAAVFASSLSAVTNPQKVKRSPRSLHLPQQHVFRTHKSINCHPCSDVACQQPDYSSALSSEISTNCCENDNTWVGYLLPCPGGRARLVGCS